MSEKRIYNFAAGPSTLPLEVLEQAKEELINYGGSGMSVMEMSHRSKLFLSIFEQTKSDLRRILNVPETHEILFLQGGATLQFAMTAMNLITATGKADYVLTGSFATKAYDEAKKYGDVAVAASSKDRNHSYIPAQSELNVRDDISYLYYTANNTIFGTEWKYVPQVNAPLVCDMSSDILTQPIDFEKYSVVFAGAQKNMSPAGLTVVFINKDYAGHALPYTPVMLDYAAMIKGDSMHNTPPCYNIYILGLVLEWIESLGGLEAIAQRNAKKAAVIYDAIDSSRLFRALAEPEARSRMNVTFRSESDEMDKAFIAFAGENGLQNVKGYRTVGGMRASIYNAMPYEGVEKLVAFMKDFAANNPKA